MGQAVNGPVGNGEGVFGVGTTEELVKDGETAAVLPGLQKDVLQIHHLRHEVAVAVEDIVVEIDGNGDNVKPGQLTGLRRYGKTEMGEGHAKSDGFEQGGFAGHVGAGNQGDRLRDPDVIDHGVVDQWVIEPFNGQTFFNKGWKMELMFYDPFCQG